MLYEAHNQDDDLYRVETTFETNVCVYNLSSRMNMMERQLPNSSSVDRFVTTPRRCTLTCTNAFFLYPRCAELYRCRKCCQWLWKNARQLHRHERTCEGCTTILPGWLVAPGPVSVGWLDREQIRISESLR